MACWKICAGAGRRQLGDPEAGRAVAADRDPPGRAGGGGRHSRRRVQRAAGLRRDGGPGARPPHGCRRAGLHRLDRGRQVLPEILRRIQHEAGLAGMRRQVAEHRAGRRAESRRRRPPHRLRHLVQPGRGLHRGLAPDRRGQDQGRSSSRRSWRSARRCSRAIRSTPRPRWAPWSTRPRRKRVMGYIDAGKKEGAKLKMGGKQVHIDNAGALHSSRPCSTRSTTR